MHRTCQFPRHRTLPPVAYQLNSRVACTVPADDGDDMIDWDDKRCLGERLTDEYLKNPNPQTAERLRRHFRGN